MLNSLSTKLGEGQIEEAKGLRVLGQALLANGQHEPAMDAFQRSLSLLADRDPYEVARAKMQWGLALRWGGDGRRATILLEEAKVILHELGAQRDLAELEELLQR